MRVGAVTAITHALGLARPKEMVEPVGVRAAEASSSSLIDNFVAVIDIVEVHLGREVCAFAALSVTGRAQDTVAD